MDENLKPPINAHEKPKFKGAKRKNSGISKPISLKEKYKLLPGCKEKCFRKCSDKLSSENRHQINEEFWSLSFTERRLWLDGHIYIGSVLRPSTTDSEGHYTLMCFLSIDANRKHYKNLGFCQH